MAGQNNPLTKTEFLLYQTDDGNIGIETRMENETVWLSQAQMCELFDKNKRTISEHIRNIFFEGELREEQVVRKFRTTAADGKNYLVAHYNLDVIISVGYRVKSHRGTQFRIWATQRLREYITKGFTIDDKRLKQGGGAATISKNFWPVSGIFVHRKKSSGERCWLSMPPASKNKFLITVDRLKLY